MSSNTDDIERLEKTLGYVFQNKGLLMESLTHSSYSYEKELPYNYERLEFLGDAVIEMVVSEYIVVRYPDFHEGDMSALRAHIVNENSLSDIADSLGIGACVFLGKGEVMGKGAIQKSILADIFEAISAAIYIDGGYPAVRGAVIPILQLRIDEAAEKRGFLDAKSEVQRICQQMFSRTPDYKIISETGPDHAKYYTVETDMCGLSYGLGAGPSKKHAQKSAAEEALKAYYERNPRG